MTLQELHTNDTWLLIRDFKICEHLQVIENECQVWVELYILYIIILLYGTCHEIFYNKEIFIIMLNSIVSAVLMSWFKYQVLQMLCYV